MLFILGIVLVFLFLFKNLWKARTISYLNEGVTFYSHRGVKDKYPENTLNAYLNAIQNGYKAIELDVVLSKDNYLICSHNIDLEFETNGVGCFKDYTKDQLRGVKTGVYSHPSQLEPICTLDEVLKSIPADILLNIELKTEKWSDLKPGRVLNNYRKKGLLNRKYIVSTFNPFLVFYIRFFTSLSRVAFLLSYRNWAWMINWIHPDALHPTAELLSSDLLEYCKNKKLLVNTWTVNNEAALEACLEKNINGIITDRLKPMIT